MQNTLGLVAILGAASVAGADDFSTASVQVVPEPTTLAAISGLAALVLRRRSRREVIC